MGAMESGVWKPSWRVWTLPQRQQGSPEISSNCGLTCFITYQQYSLSFYYVPATMPTRSTKLNPTKPLLRKTTADPQKQLPKQRCGSVGHSRWAGPVLPNPSPRVCMRWCSQKNKWFKIIRREKGETGGINSCCNQNPHNLIKGRKIVPNDTISLRQKSCFFFEQKLVQNLFCKQCSVPFLFWWYHLKKKTRVCQMKKTSTF